MENIGYGQGAAPMTAEGKNKASLKCDVKEREILILNDAKS